MESKYPVSVNESLETSERRNPVVSHLPQTILCKLLENNPISYYGTNSTSIISNSKDVMDSMEPKHISVNVKHEPNSPNSSITDISCNNSYSLKNQSSVNSSTISICSSREIVDKYRTLSPSETVKLNPKKRLLQRHLLEKFSEIDKEDETKNINLSPKSSQDPEAPFGRGKNGKPLTRSPFVPSYMDPTSGPFFCKVCGYKASGLHYKVMACEGCKGFFRRSVQKKLKYVCKMNSNCPINSDNRTKCQECRWQLCIKAGMDVESVLDDKERRAKNELIKVNRLKRKQADLNSFSHRSIINEKNPLQQTLEIPTKDQFDPQHKALLALIDLMTEAFETAFNICEEQKAFPSPSLSQGLTHEFTNRVTIFAKKIPGVSELSLSMQNTLLRNRCLDIICLCTALTYNAENDKLKLPNKKWIDSTFVTKHKHLEPLWQFAKRTAEHQLTKSEMAILAGLALLANNTPEPLETVYNQLLAALDLIMIGQPIRNSKLLIAIFSDLQGLTSKLFELRAPLGHQLLFDADTDIVSSETPTSNSLGRGINLGHMIAINQSAEERTKPVSSMPSSIYTFSYSDKNL